jgi:diguanylate cyclase (GGDEF)-like protein
MSPISGQSTVDSRRWWVGPLMFLAVALAYGGLAQATVWLHAPTAFDAGVLAGRRVEPGRAAAAVPHAVGMGDRRGRGRRADGEPGLGVAAGAVAVVGGRELAGPTGRGDTAAPVRQPAGAARTAAQPAFVPDLRGARRPVAHRDPRHDRHLRISEGPVDTLWQVWPSYLLSDALGVLVLAPLLLAWRHRGLARHPAEVGALSVALLAVGLVALAGADTATRHGAAVPDPSAADLGRVALRDPRGRGRGLRPGTGGDLERRDWPGPVRDGLRQRRSGAATGLPAGRGAVGVRAGCGGRRAQRQHRGPTSAHPPGATRRSDRTAQPPLPHRVPVRPDRDLAVGACGGVRRDLDHFKFVNDGLGHLPATRCSSRPRVDWSARFVPAPRGRSSGDEFIAVLDATKPTSSARARLMDSVSEPMTLSTGSVITQSISIGIADGSPDRRSRTHLRGADAALHHAKRISAGHRVYRFDDHLRAEDLDRRMVQTDLATRARTRTDRLPLPARDRPRDRPGRLLRGARPLEPPHRRAAHSRPVHPRHRGHGRDRPAVRACSPRP